MKTNPNQYLNDLSLEELVEILIEKTSALLMEKENGIDRAEFKNLLLQVEELSQIIKNKRNSNFG